jgi:hypothetical protein
VFHADDSGVERKRPGAELVEGRRDVRRVHYFYVN